MRIETQIEKHDRLVLEAVHHPELYARKVSVLEQDLGLTTSEILAVVSRNPSIGTFTNNGELFVGLKERKVEYDKDVTLGINPFEPNYRGDDYRASVLKGKSRFEKK